ncbi:MAG: hypothetical protein ACR2ME_09725 [Acidimicrobiia bacterium]
MAAAAIQEFANEFGRHVFDARLVVVPGDLDIAALRLLVAPPKEVAQAAPDDLETYWQILSVTEESNYWRVEMASVDGSVYFSGPLFFQVIDGEPVLVQAEDVGETQITSDS